MSEMPSIPEALESYISNEMVQVFEGLLRFGVTRLEADLIEMSIRLQLAPRGDRIQISVSSIPLTTDPPVV
jgi:hypothetical protein